jgi:hypothetical protein
LNCPDGTVATLIALFQTSLDADGTALQPTSKYCGVAVNLLIISEGRRFLNGLFSNRSQERCLEARPALSLDKETRHLGRSWLDAALDALDSRLRLRQGVIEYTCRPDCLFRIQVVESCDDILLSDGARVRRGDRLVRLHVWNEQFPAFPAGGPTVAWARRVNRAFDISLRELAHLLDVRQDLHDITAICGNMTFAPADRSAQLARFVSRFGFEKIEIDGSQSFRQRMHWFGENILISMIVLTHNATALRADTLWRDRTLVFLSRQALLRRYRSVHDQAA